MESTEATPRIFEGLPLLYTKAQSFRKMSVPGSVAGCGFCRWKQGEMLFEQMRIDGEIARVKHELVALKATIMPEAKADDIARRDGMQHRLALFSKIADRLEKSMREMETKAEALQNASDTLICHCR